MICSKSAVTALMKATLVVAIATALSAAHAQTFTSLYSFTGSPDGDSPQSTLLDLNGMLYFARGADGSFPESGLIIDEQGALYSTTNEGGDVSCNLQIGCGTVFKIVP